MVLDAAVPRDDEPAASRHLRNPHGVERGSAGDGARWALASVHDAACVAWIGDVRSQLGDLLGQPEHVGIEVEADGRRLRRPTRHAACSEVS